MTVRDILCKAGVKNLAEYLCKPCIGGDKVFIPMSSMCGSLQVSDIDGSLQVSDLNGSLQVSDLNGNLENKTLGGTICQI